ncbi:unnamed protein product, partial [Symbiodinium sp. KB8]
AESAEEHDSVLRVPHPCAGDAGTLAELAKPLPQRVLRVLGTRVGHLESREKHGNVTEARPLPLAALATCWAAWLMRCEVDACGSHALACAVVMYGPTPFGGALCSDAVEQVVPHESLAHTTAPTCAYVRSHDLHHLDLVIYSATPLGGGKGDDYPELNAGGPQQLVVLGSEVGGRQNAGAHQLLRDLVCARSALVASSAWAGVGGPTGKVMQGLHNKPSQALPWGQFGLHRFMRANSGPRTWLDSVLDIAGAAGPSRLEM